MIIFLMKLPFRLLPFCVAIFFLQISVAQNVDFQQLENDMRAASGPARVEKLLILSDAEFAAGRYDQAADWAEEAAEFAQKIRQQPLRAAALNRFGKALAISGKKRAAGKFEQSMEILRDIRSDDKNLALDNLENLRKLAQRSGRDKEITMLDEQIARLRGGGVTVVEPVGRQDLRQEMAVIQQQATAALTAAQAAQQNQVELLSQSKELQAELAAKQAKLDFMTDAQIKAEIRLMQQRLMIDSVVYRAGIDSLSVSNANLALQEAASSRNFNYAIMIGLLLLAAASLVSFVRARQNTKVLAEKNKIIEQERERSENLLLNILPSLVAEELKRKGRTEARYFEDASVLFADFVGFSQIAEQLTPQQLVSELDTCFQEFDRIMAENGLEKIKTIGDAYMCAGGLNGGGAQLRDMVHAAKAMQAWLFEWNAERQQQGLPRFDARVGIHCGPVVAGVVGSKKFAFDIWGDTVNIAARIEQASEGGRINISGEAFAVIQNFFPCKYRGKIPAKNKGDIDMYFVEN